MAEELERTRLRGEQFFVAPPQTILNDVRAMAHDSVDAGIKKLRETLEKETKNKSDAIAKAPFLRASPHTLSSGAFLSSRFHYFILASFFF